MMLCGYLITYFDVVNMHKIRRDLSVSKRAVSAKKAMPGVSIKRCVFKMIFVKLNRDGSVNAGDVFYELERSGLRGYRAAKVEEIEHFIALNHHLVVGFPIVSLHRQDRYYSTLMANGSVCYQHDPVPRFPVRWDADDHWFAFVKEHPSDVAEIEEAERKRAGRSLMEHEATRLAMMCG